MIACGVSPVPAALARCITKRPSQRPAVLPAAARPSALHLPSSPAFRRSAFRSTGVRMRRSAAPAVPKAAATTADAEAKWITGVTPNSNVLRAVVAAGAVAATAAGSPLLSAQALRFLHLSIYSTLFGSIFYTTFVLGIALFKAVPRQTFRDVQEVLFPKYFALGILCCALLLVTAPQVLAGAYGERQIAVLAVALASNVVNLFVLEPRTTKVMKERAVLEKMAASEATAAYPEGKEARLKALGGAFGKFHGLSSLFNLIVLGCIVSHGWFFIGSI